MALVFRSAKSPGMMALFALLMLILATASILALIFLTGAGRIVVAAIDILLILLFIWVLCATYYTFGDSALILRCGPLREEYDYSELKTALRTRGYGFVMALAFDRLELNAGLNP